MSLTPQLDAYLHNMANRAMPFDLTLKDLRIPYVAAWELEQPNITFDFSVMANAVYTGDVDHREAAMAGTLGKVLLGKMAPQRQRHCMVHDICQVCGKALLVKVSLGNPERYNNPDGTSFMAMDEPCCCPACALVAVTLCPFAKRAWANRGGMLVGEKILRLQLATVLKGDDPSAMFKSTDAKLPRHVLRRNYGKPMVMHVRMTPMTGAIIEGPDGIAKLEALAAKEQQL